jgi:hypothetical protein
MKKRRSDIPRRTGRVEMRRFKIYWNMVYAIRKYRNRSTVTRPHSHNPSLPPLNLRGGEVGLWIRRKTFIPYSILI